MPTTPTITIKDTAIGISILMNTFEEALNDENCPARSAGDALHAGLRVALYRHRAELGLSDDDVSEIDNAGVAKKGGVPKGPPPNNV